MTPVITYTYQNSEIYRDAYIKDIRNIRNTSHMDIQHHNVRILDNFTCNLLMQVEKRNFL